ncbi:hypothetical protein BJV74DRAFT_787975, partial [Russula compacta]
EMDEVECTLAKQLHDVLQIFNDATKFFSRSKVANLTMVILAMDHLDKHLVMAMISLQEYLPAIYAAIHIRKKTLNHYYSKTDQSDLYCIAMGMSQSNLQRGKRTTDDI